MPKTKKLSHIIIYADKNLPSDPFWTFCTNIGSENPDTDSVFISYDNQIDAGGVNQVEHIVQRDADTDTFFFISDSNGAIEYAQNSGIASCALLTKYNKGRSFPGVLYCIEDIEYISFSRVERMWMRYHDIPWTITKTKRLVIREQTLDDLDGLYEIYSDPGIVRYTEDLYKDRAQEADYLQKYIDNQYRFFEYGIWALTLKGDGTLIGRAGISRREGYELPEIGFVIGKEYQRQGYAKEAVKAIINYGRTELGFKEYMAFTRPANTAGIRLLESLGFTPAGHTVISGHEHAMYTIHIGLQPLTKPQ
ncbi:MAG: GNAT family N-acetyltransferase [Lachnospiraceae bacterium]|nr:GNAT family N-acetyltransferase [Lachnospiraceae bacterium]